MGRGRRGVTGRGATITLWLAGVVLSGISCRGEDIAAPPGSGAAAEVGRALRTAAVQTLVFRQVMAGGMHTCGVTTSDRAYCWGHNLYGNLGDGTTSRRLVPVAVAGSLQFRQVTAGGNHACGVTTSDQAYCWGDNNFGQLGDGISLGKKRVRPTRVAGGLRFRQVVGGGLHTCGVTTDDKAYCWGHNDKGQVGDATQIERNTPSPVAGGLRFRQVTAGSNHSCGVTTGNRAYCWGGNFAGQLGTGTTDLHIRISPVAVAGGLAFRQLGAGGSHTCGVTTGDRAYCWGDNNYGQIGDGTTTQRLSPVAVAGGRRILRVSAGEWHTCAVNPSNVAFCWGIGSLTGDGTNTTRLTPVRVVGGLPFGQVSAGGTHTCGVTIRSVAYCWGSNGGQLGDGTTANRPRPVAVSDAM